MTPNPGPWGLSRIDYDGTRTPLKTVLFVVLCLAWLLPGLAGHDPWKVDEAVAFGAVNEMLRTGDWLAFRIAGEPFMDRAPLYLWTAAGFVKLLGGLMPAHDAARMASGFYMAATLLALMMAAREALGERGMRMAALLFIGCVGLLLRAHEMTPDLAGLAGVAVSLWGLALAARKPAPGGAAIGVGMGVAFLGDGFLPLAMVAATLAALPLASPAWRTRAHGTASAVAIACAAPLVAAWPLLLLASGQASLLHAWIEGATASRWASDNWRDGPEGLSYFLKILPWYAWPAWPLAAWTVYRARRTLGERRAVVLPLVAFAAMLAMLLAFGETREVNAMPLLVPLALLGVAEIESLPRGGASALDWFGVTTFFLFATLLWLGWAAAVAGQPAFALAWLQREVPGFTYRFSFTATALAALLTLIWLVVVARSLRSTRRAVVNWTAGITMVWMLVMTLGVPLVDQARSYRGVAGELAKALPTERACVLRRNVGDAQRAVLDYFIGLRTVREDDAAAARCGHLLLQGAPGRFEGPGAGWAESWRGARPGDRNELFVLYRRVAPMSSSSISTQ